METIGNSAFATAGISKVVILPNIHYGENCFTSSKLKTVEVAEGVKKLTEGIFSFCRDLQSVILNEGLEEIDSVAFRGCKSLRKIIIPKRESISYLHPAISC